MFYYKLFPLTGILVPPGLGRAAGFRRGGCGGWDVAGGSGLGVGRLLAVSGPGVAWGGRR